MRNLICIVVLAVIILAIVGHYQGWFTIGTESKNGKTDIHLQVDKEKAKENLSGGGH